MMSTERENIERLYRMQNDWDSEKNEKRSIEKSNKKDKESVMEKNREERKERSLNEF